MPVLLPALVVAIMSAPIDTHAAPLVALRTLLDPGLGGVEASFGRSIAATGSRLLVGSPGEEQGVAYVYEASTG